MNTIVDEVRSIDIDLSFKDAAERTDRSIHEHAEKIEKTEKEREITQKELEEAVDKANDLSKVFNRQLNFSVHSATGIDQVVIKVVDLENNETVKEIPNTEFLDFLARLKEAEGILFDEKV